MHLPERGYRPGSGGQGVFGIAIGRVWREIEMNLNGQPGEEMHENFEGDELAARRARRAQA